MLKLRFPISFSLTNWIMFCSRWNGIVSMDDKLLHTYINVFILFITFFSSKKEINESGQIQTNTTSNRMYLRRFLNVINLFLLQIQLITIIVHSAQSLLPSCPVSSVYGYVMTADTYVVLHYFIVFYYKSYIRKNV